MKKVLVILVLICSLLLSLTVVNATEAPVLYKDTITVTADGGRYQIGFVNVEFKKDFLDLSLLPATFDVQVYADNGTGTIEFLPGTPEFFKKVHIRVGSYEGLLFDKAENKNVQVDYKKQQILADHFSRFCW